MDWLAAFTGVYRGAEAYRQAHAGACNWEKLDDLHRAAWMREALRPAAQRQYEGDRTDHRVTREDFARSRPVRWLARRQP